MRVHLRTKSTAEKFKDHTFPCRKCAEPIKAGQKFFTWKHNHAPASYQHQEHGGPKTSELCTGKMSGVYAAIEDANIAVQEARNMNDASGLKQVLEDCSSAVEDVRSEYESSLENMPESLQGGPTGEGIQEKIDGLQSFIDELESADCEYEEEPEPAEPDGTHTDECPITLVENGEAESGECNCGEQDKEDEHSEWETNHESGLEETFTNAENALESLSI